MIDFIYTGKYSVFDQPDDKICRPEEPGHHKPKQSCPTKSSSSSSYPSHNTTPPAASTSEYARQMLAHADVYVVAEFFQVPALAKMAASVIDDELKARFADMLGVFPKLAQTICAGIPASADDDPSSCFSYFSTPKTLRGRVMKFGHQHMHAFTTADRLWDVLDEAPDFMEEAIEGMRLKLTVAANRISGLEDRVAALHITLGRYQAYKCPCGERFKMAMPTTAGVTVGCPRCKRTRLATTWDRKTYRLDA
ncbi:hypothetical protein SLS55_007250 [Diplodia seriata]|uniref:BTB domain-containing protein n=1 Tax=Diplodia seriata TaxID=420778 RepID=A0ABR3CC17_9PEZI